MYPPNICKISLRFSQCIFLHFLKHNFLLYLTPCVKFQSKSQQYFMGFFFKSLFYFFFLFIFISISFKTFRTFISILHVKNKKCDKDKSMKNSNKQKTINISEKNTKKTIVKKMITLKKNYEILQMLQKDRSKYTSLSIKTSNR